MSSGIRRYEHDVLAVVVVEKLRDGNDEIAILLRAGGGVAGQLLYARLDARVLLRAPRPHRADENLQVLDRPHERALQLGLPRGCAAHDVRRDQLDTTGQAGEPARPGHGRAAAKTASGGRELAGVGGLHSFLRDQRLQSSEIITRLEDKEVQQPARRRHQRILQIVSERWVLCGSQSKVRTIMTTERRASLPASPSPRGRGR